MGQRPRRHDLPFPGRNQPNRRPSNLEVSMRERTPEDEPNAELLAELSALADGSIDPKRAPVVRELIAKSSDLTRRYERELQAVAALRELREDRAPLGLRLALDARQAPTPRRRTRVWPAGALAATVAAAVALLVLLLPGGSPGAPSVSQAAALALRGSDLRPPALDPVHRTKLMQDVQQVYFPNWGLIGWRASGRRVDRFAGRLAVTVYYTDTWLARRVAYTILETPALPWPTPRTTSLDGIELQSLLSHGRQVITWRRAGHTCVLSGEGMSVAELAKLARWEVPGSGR